MFAIVLKVKNNKCKVNITNEIKKQLTFTCSLWAKRATFEVKDVKRKHFL
jgi:hypothetical protein